MDISNVSVIGGGTMGNSIAHVFAMKGFNVNLVETSEQLLERSFSTISQNLDRQVKKAVITESDKDLILKRINKVISVENIPVNTDLIIEAIYENKEAKLSIFNKLDKFIKPETIFASNTSSISITELGSSTRPDRFIGMHFMNPVPVMKLVEIIRGYSTSDLTFNMIKELSIKLDKVPVEVYDYPGFISNRILMPMINESIFALNHLVHQEDRAILRNDRHPSGLPLR